MQNVAEGSQASATSRKTEIKLTSVARSSLEELRLDYQDFLRQRGLPEWERDDPRREDLIARRCVTADEVAGWARDTRDGRSGRSGQGGHGIESTKSAPAGYAEITANGVLTLIAVARSLLDRQIASLARAFENEGGFTERLYRVRSQNRKRGDSPPSPKSTPSTGSTPSTDG